MLIDNRHYNCIYSVWPKVNHGITQDSILGPLFLLLYINDLPKIITDDTSILISKPIATKIINDNNEVFLNINDWFIINLPPLNFDKTYCIQLGLK